MKDYEKAEFNFEKLFLAYLDCKKRKSTTFQAMQFEIDRENNLLELYDEILSGKYEVGKSICFVVTDPKPREVWAGSFRDRIVHHLIYSAIKERFESKFIYDTYSCLKGKGTLAGVKRAVKFSRNITQNYTKDAYFIKMDIKNYFVSINKTILYDLVKEYIDENEEKWLLDLIKKVIFHDPRKNVYIKSPKKIRNLLPPHKSLFNCSDECGLPIGNLTSQFFSNVYLNKLDQYAKHVLKCKNYIRYVDDILIMDKDPGFLNYSYAKINRFLIDNLALELNHRKKNINHIHKGFDFLGYVIKPNRIHTRRRTVKKCYKALTEWKNSKNRYDKEVLELFRNKMNSYLGFMRYSDSYNLRKKMSGSLESLLIYPDKDCLKFNIAA